MADGVAVKLPALAVMLIVRTEVSPPVVSTAVAVPVASVTALVTVTAPLVAVKATVTPARELLSALVAIALTVMPSVWVSASDGKAVAELIKRRLAGVMVVPPELVPPELVPPELLPPSSLNPPPPPQAEMSSAHRPAIAAFPKPSLRMALPTRRRCGVADIAWMLTGKINRNKQIRTKLEAISQVRVTPLCSSDADCGPGPASRGSPALSGR